MIKGITKHERIYTCNTFVVYVKKIELDRHFLKHFQNYQSGYITVSFWVAVNIVRGSVWVSVSIVSGGVSVAVSIIRGGVWAAVNINRGGVWAEISLRELVEKVVGGLSYGSH